MADLLSARPSMSARRHTRFCEVDGAYGCLTVTVVLEDLNAQAAAHDDTPLVLATIVPPYGAVHFEPSYRFVDLDEFDRSLDDPQEIWSGGSVGDTVHEFSAGSVRLYWIAAKPWLHGRSLVWMFRASAAFPYLEADHWYPDTDSFWQRQNGKPIRSHVLRVPCEYLELIYLLPHGCRSVRPVVQVPADEFNLRSDWSDVTPSAQIRSFPRGDAVGFSLRITNPSFGARYAMEIVPATLPFSDEREAELEAADTFATDLAYRLRNEVFGHTPLTDALRSKVLDRLVRFAEESSPGFRCDSEPDRDFRSRSISLVGMLWSRDAARLQGCFGIGSLAELSCEYRFGQGIGGHAFRFDQAAVYRPSAGRQTSAARPELMCTPAERRLEWALAVPIRFKARKHSLDSSQVPIGVFWIGARTPPVKGTLTDALFSVLRNQKGIEYLAWSLSFAFWEAVAPLLADPFGTLAAANYHLLLKSKPHTSYPPMPAHGALPAAAEHSTHFDAQAMCDACKLVIARTMESNWPEPVERKVIDTMRAGIIEHDRATVTNFAELEASVRTLERREKARQDDEFVRDNMKAIKPQIEDWVLDAAGANQAVMAALKILLKAL